MEVRAKGLRTIIGVRTGAEGDERMEGTQHFDFELEYNEEVDKESMRKRHLCVEVSHEAVI